MMTERIFESILFASRWLLAPIYLGLSAGLLLIGFKFYQEVIHFMLIVASAREGELVLAVLGLIDLSLVGGLVIMVMLSGYENFVSRLDVVDENNVPKWLGKLDATSLKLKVAASIVAISSIHLLQKFMDAEHIANDKLMWFVIIHLTFVLSAVMMAVMDRMRKH